MEPIDLLEIEIDPPCEHLFRMKYPDDREWCWICGEDIPKDWRSSLNLVASAAPWA